MRSITDMLGPEGPLARHVDGFAPRAVQQEMAEAVQQALEARGTLIVEAGTGTGKTFAYLVPALANGQRVIISTGTRTLQDQLYHRDLPLVRDALEIPVRIAQLKGRANYLCRHRLEIAASEMRWPSRQAVSDLQVVRDWAGRTGRGDIAEVTNVTEDSAVWPLVTSTTDNCLGQECPWYGDCYVLKARREAQEAEVVVINHHLLFADLALKEEGFGDLLPGADAFILDEAHQLPETAAQFFGVSLSARQLLELGRDALGEQLREAGDMGDLAAVRDRLEQAVREFRLGLGEQGRVAWSALPRRVPEKLEALRAALLQLNEWLEVAAPRSKGLDQCWRRSNVFLERLDLLSQERDEYIRWVDVHPRTFTFHLTPLDVAGAFAGAMQSQQGAWVFTSATLAVGQKFDHFAQRLGIEAAQTRFLESPFNYEDNALLYVPPGLSDPGTPDYTEQVVDAALPVLEASRGRAFVLFTSHRALQMAAGLLRERLDYPLLVQGEAPRGELLERFRALGDAVLLGTGSFWEGVDVRGAALSCVIIDKLPFAAPGDPVLQARIEALRQAGHNPFMEYQLPAAVIALKQGVGRLIRDVDDRGVMMLCDPRLFSKPYGRLFLHSLPPMSRTRQLQDVQAFFTRTGVADAEEPSDQGATRSLS